MSIQQQIVWYAAIYLASALITKVGLREIMEEDKDFRNKYSLIAPDALATFIAFVPGLNLIAALLVIWRQIRSLWNRIFNRKVEKLVNELLDIIKRSETEPHKMVSELEQENNRILMVIGVNRDTGQLCSLTTEDVSPTAIKVALQHILNHIEEAPLESKN